MWYASPANVRIRWAAASPSGIAPNWHANSSLREWLRGSPPRPYGGFWLAITSNPGALISGGIPSTHAMPPFRPPFRSSSLSIHVSCLMMRWSYQLMRKPPDNLVLVSLLRGPLNLGICPTAMSMHIGAVGP
jgi:hypothetical protein